jgi:hypothetical protein
MEKERTRKKKVDTEQLSSNMQIKVKLSSSKRISGGNRITVTVSLLDSTGKVISEDSDFINIT